MKSCVRLYLEVDLAELCTVVGEGLPPHQHRLQARKHSKSIRLNAYCKRTATLPCITTVNHNARTLKPRGTYCFGAETCQVDLSHLLRFAPLLRVGRVIYSVHTRESLMRSGARQGEGTVTHQQSIQK